MLDEQTAELECRSHVDHQKPGMGDSRCRECLVKIYCASNLRQSVSESRGQVKSVLSIILGRPHCILLGKVQHGAIITILHTNIARIDTVAALVFMKAGH
jgi:hypothetical protein